MEDLAWSLMNSLEFVFNHLRMPLGPSTGYHRSMTTQAAAETRIAPLIAEPH